MGIKNTFEKKLNELNLKRQEQGKTIIHKKDLAKEIFKSNKSSATSKTQLLSSILSGNRRCFKSDELRIIRKIFSCTIDELYPISEDLDIDISVLN